MDKTKEPKHQFQGSHARIAFSWLLYLRWGAVFCQILLIAAVAVFFHPLIPFAIISSIIGFEVASNCYFTFLLKREKLIPEWLFASVMFVDTGLLTILLLYTGGPMNPFTFLYLVHTVVGSFLMKPRWSWSLALFTIFCYATLFFLPGANPMSDIAGVHSGNDQTICASTLAIESQVEDHMKMHLQGMWLAFAITTLFTVFFIGKIQMALEKHQITIEALKAAKIRNEKLASLATLAAGAAHEFSTPLASIAVASGEMLHFLKEKKGPEELLEDTLFIRDQVGRCKEILFQMAADAGEHLGESLQELSVDELLDNVVSTFTEDVRKKIIITNDAEKLMLRVPSRTLARILRGLLKNGLDASEGDESVFITCSKTKDSLVFIVKDLGAGMDNDTLARSTEPFYTTKEPGKGLGLGLFLAKSAAERLGGSLKIMSELGKGTTVTLTLALRSILK